MEKRHNLENDHSPATKADFQELKRDVLEVKRDILELKGDVQEIKRDNQALVEGLEAKLERVETNLLTEFHKWAQTYEMRSRGTVQTVHNFEERLKVLEERVGNLERRRT